MPLVPAAWMPNATMARVIVHWTAGGHKATNFDRGHYHLLIEADGKVVKGIPSIKANEKSGTKGYAAHTLKCNTGSIGVSMCCMAGAVERPFNPGKSPMTQQQWSTTAKIVAELCARYGIPVTPTTVLSHAEVQPNLKIKQKGKWDITRLAFDPAIKGAKACGDRFRNAVRVAMGTPAAAAPLVSRPSDEPMPEPIDGKAASQILVVQKKLIDLGYWEVGVVTDVMETRARGAFLAFKADWNERNPDDQLPLDTEITPAALTALFKAGPRSVAPARANAGEEAVADHAAVKQAKKAGWFAKIGAALGIGGVAEETGLVDQVEGVSWSVQRLWGAVEPVWGWVRPLWPFIVLGGAYLLWRWLRDIRKEEVESYRLGETP